MKKRIMWVGFAITAIALIVFSVISAEIYYDNDVAYSHRYLRAYMAAFDDTRTEDQLDAAYAKELSDALGGARVTFLTAEGEFLADSEDEDDASRSLRPEVQDAIRSGEGFSARVSETLGDTFMYYCKRFDGYLVRIADRTQSMGSIYLDSLPAVGIFLLADALVCLLLSYLSTGYILKPLEQLARDAACKKRVEAPVHELRSFAKIINRMNEDAEQRVQEIAEEHGQVVRAQQSKDEFIANVTHEMNTPLTSIRGFAELLAAGGLEGDRAARAAKTILTQSERLQSLVASIINYSEIDSEDLPVYEVDASRIARDILAALTPEFREKKVVLLSEIKDGVLLMSRQERVTEIFGNIIRNAIRYNREGGSVSVLLTQEEFSVSDTGIGISEENLPRIFDRFFTIDKSHNGKNGGFGLGLSVVKKLCKKQGWTLTVESKEGVGSTFRIGFPAAEPPQNADPASADRK
mgnify:FL=1